MPKEQINTPMRRTVTQFPDGGYGCGWTEEDQPLAKNQHREETPVVYVGWSHEIESVMQVSVVVSAKEILRAADQLRPLVGVAAEGESWMFTSTRLSRTESQKLIKVTRRARDQVFGGDE